MPQYKIIFRQLGVQAYESVYRDMRTFTDRRNNNTQDEIWLLQHSPIFTQGLNGKAEHVLAPKGIPVVQTDRGGQVTFHGPGQLIAYVLIDLVRRNWGIRQLVTALEKAVLTLLLEYNIEATTQPKAPGVYVTGKKIASLGLRIRKGKSYHGVSLNVDMDLEPFSRINPCGFADLEVTQLRDLIGPTRIEEVQTKFSVSLLNQLG